jgi:pimeloyl-ACP methyl ester carboxylesterase
MYSLMAMWLGFPSRRVVARTHSLFYTDVNFSSLVGMAATRVVLVHGTRDNERSFEPVRALLADLDVVTYTRRGWKRTDDMRPVPLEQHVDDLIEVLDGTPSVVVGHSWGGKVAIGAAIRRPDLVLSTGIFETAMLWRDDWPAEHGDHLRRAIDRVRRKLIESGERRRERTLFVAEASVAWDEPFDLGELAVPCVLGVGGQSIDTFVEGMRIVAASMGAEVFEIADASHMAHREQPEEFAAFVRRAVALAGESEGLITR